LFIGLQTFIFTDEIHLSGSAIGAFGGAWRDSAFAVGEV